MSWHASNTLCYSTHLPNCHRIQALEDLFSGLKAVKARERSWKTHSVDSPTHNNNLPAWDSHSELVPLPVFMREIMCKVPASELLDVHTSSVLPEVDKVADTATQSSHSLQRAKLLWGLIQPKDDDPTQSHNIIKGVRRLCVLVAEQEQLLNNDSRVEVMHDDVHYLMPMSRAAFEDGALLAMVPPEDDDVDEGESALSVHIKQGVGPANTLTTGCKLVHIDSFFFFS